MLFELRQYRIKDGKMAQWVKLMEEEIIPYQVSKGMVVVGSFTGLQEEDLYIWIRRFKNEAERQRLYKKVYESDEWKNRISPKVGDLMIREKIVVTQMAPTPKSVVS